MSKSAGGKFLIQDGQTVVMIGDSITDCCRRDQQYPFGDGYVREIIDLVTARYPERRITWYNSGIGGDSAAGLCNRWADDVIRYRPDWVSIMIGINDLNHRWWTSNPDEWILPPRYRESYQKILTGTKEETDARIILMDPFYISRDTRPTSQRTEVLRIIGDYTAVVRELAEQFDCLHVPLHDIFQRQLEFRSADTFCPEPVHPNATGHRVIAEAWLRAVGW